MKDRHWTWKLRVLTAFLFMHFLYALPVEAQSPPTINTQPGSQTNFVGATVAFSVNVSGTGPFTYKWLFNGTELPNNVMVTVAGNGSAAYAGDGGPATNACLNGLQGVALDGSGNLFIADTGNNSIRKVDTNGTITTLAGNGTAGYSGDGGASTNGSLNFPTSIAVDARGNLFIADQYNHRIRKIDTNGIISTAAGNGALLFPGTTAGTYSGDGGLATVAGLSYPSGVAVDASGNLYIADSDNHRVRMVDTNNIISTVAGNGHQSSTGDGGPATSASLYDPYGLALDSHHNLFIVEFMGDRVRRVDTNGTITTVAGNGSGLNYPTGDGGQATNATLIWPFDVAFDPQDNLYISAGYTENSIRKVDHNGIITTVVGGNINGPYAMTFDALGNLYFADSVENQVREVYYSGYPILTLNAITATNAGNYSVVINNSSGSVTSSVAVLTVAIPPSIKTQPANQGVWLGSNATFKVNATGSPPLYYEWYFNGTNLVQNSTNSSLIISNCGPLNVGKYMVVVTNSYGSVSSTNVNLQLPPAVAISTQPASRTNLVGSTASFTVSVDGVGPFTYQWLFNGTNISNNIISTVVGNGGAFGSGDGGPAVGAGIGGPTAMAFDASGNMYIASGPNNRVRMVDLSGVITSVAGNGSGDFSGDGVPATNTAVYHPNGLVFDPSGNLFIATSYNPRIRKVDINGIISTFAGTNYNSNIGGFSGDGGLALNATMNVPFGLAMDTIGNLYIADASNNRIRMVDTNGIIATVAGNGNAAYGGDDGAATNGALNSPLGVVLDRQGNLYIADSGNDRIRKVNTNGIISTFAGGGSGGDGGAATNAALNNPLASVSSPLGVALDSFGNLYIADGNKCSIRKVDTNGIITTVAGNGANTFAGDGGAATNASFSIPYGVAFDSVGNMYVADTGNNRIRKIHYTGDPILNLPAINTNTAGDYSVIITGPFGSVTSVVARLTVVLPPTILTQPTNQTVVAGSNVSFSVTATGTPPLNYSWYLNGQTLIQDGSNSNLTLPSVIPANNGNYTVVVSNPYSSVTSQVATLTVGFPPGVTISGNQTVLPGNDVFLSSTATGTGPLSYQWQFNGTNLPYDIITTVAGNGTGTYAGDGGSAVNASLNAPRGIWVSASGEFYIADSFNNRVRKVDATGIISTVAGNGTQSFSGDGGLATNASMVNPFGVAVDSLGKVYVADAGNGRIRIIDTNGMFNTFAGGGSDAPGGLATNTGLLSPRAVAVDSIGNLYIADTGDNVVLKVDTNHILITVAGGGSDGDGGVATNASIGFPSGLALDGKSSLYIGDYNGNRVHRLDTNGILIGVAGNGSYGASQEGSVATNTSLSAPAGVAIDSYGDLYIADTGAYRVRRVDSNGIITTVAGKGTLGFSGDGGVATNAQLGAVYGLALDASGNLFIADPSNNRIRKVQLDAGYPTLKLNSVSSLNAGIYSVVVSSPFGSVTSSISSVIVQAPPIIVVQPASQLAVVGNGAVFSSVAAGSGPVGYSWFFNGTNLLQIGTNNSLSLAGVSTNDAGNYTVIATNGFGSVTSQVATLTVAIPPSVSISGNPTVFSGGTVTFNAIASGTGPLNYQWQLNGNNLSKTISVVAGGGTPGVLGDGGAATNAYLNGPNPATVDMFGNLLIADWGNNRVRKVTTNGVISTVAGNGSTTASSNGSVATNTGINHPAFVFAGATGDFFVAENGTSLIAMVGTNGILRNVAGKGVGTFGGDGGAATNAFIRFPFGIARDTLGNIFIADSGNNRIRKVGTNGVITTVAGRGTGGPIGDGGQATNASLLSPNGIFVDGSGNLLISDTGNHRIRRVGTNGIITTIAGNGIPTFSGDGGAATNAGINNPTAVVLDAIGNLLIADQNNNRIRQVSPNGTITTIAGGGFISPGNGVLATSVALSHPSSVALDAIGNTFIADNLHNLILELTSGLNMTLTNVGGGNAGNYTVVVTSPYGSVTSSVAPLTVILSPQNLSASVGNDSTLQLQLTGTPNYPYTLVATTNLTPPVLWQPVVTNVAGSNGIWTFHDTNSPLVPTRFYRALAH